MKSIFLVFTLVLAVCVLNVIADSCWGPNDFKSCKRDECCLRNQKYRNKYECEDKGDNVNERCGGDYACNDCAKNLVCVRYPKSDIGSCQPAFRRG